VVELSRQKIRLRKGLSGFFSYQQDSIKEEVVPAKQGVVRHLPALIRAKVS
jgi:hypothetical protein